MRTWIIAVAVVAFALFVANELTRTIPVYVAAGLWGGTIGFLIGCWQLSKVLRPEDAPPPLTGPPLAKSWWRTGHIGPKRIVSDVSATVYADRLVLRMWIVARRTIMADQLGPISAHGRHQSRVQIEHRAPGLASPVTLRLRENHPVRRAIMELVSR